MLSLQINIFNIGNMATVEGIELDLTNEEFNHAVEFVQHTDRLVYLTGKAGTGKTTFLKYIIACVFLPILFVKLLFLLQRNCKFHLLLEVHLPTWRD